MPLPIAHGLIGASIVAAVLPDASLARNWKPLMLGAAAASFADLDYLLETSRHRSLTHSLLFAGIVSVLCFAIRRSKDIRVKLGCAGAIFSHGLVDFATTKMMPGVELLWPFSARRFSLGLIDYYQLTNVDPVFFLTKDVARDLLKMVRIELLICLPLFLFVLAVKWSLQPSGSFMSDESKHKGEAGEP
jgi:membrane-bound metal-dependent hydrolase YbcI (DUF457 family)